MRQGRQRRWHGFPIASDPEVVPNNTKKNISILILTLSAGELKKFHAITLIIIEYLSIYSRNYLYTFFCSHAYLQTLDLHIQYYIHEALHIFFNEFKNKKTLFFFYFIEIYLKGQTFSNTTTKQLTYEIQSYCISALGLLFPVFMTWQI